MLTRFIPILASDLATDNFEVDFWADIITAFGCMPDAENLETVDSRLKEGMARGKLSPQWDGAAVIKVTIELVRPCDNLSTCDQEGKQAKS